MAAPKAKKQPSRGKPTAGKNAAEHRRHLFIESYLVNGGNATKAALAAGFSAAGASVTGSNLLKHPKVLLILEQRQAALVQKLELNTESVLRSLSQALFLDPRKLLNADGSVKSIHELDDDTAMALTRFEVFEEFSGSGKSRKYIGQTKKLKWLDKNVARDQAHKILGHYKKDNEQPAAAMAEAVKGAGLSIDAYRLAFEKACEKAGV